MSNNFKAPEKLNVNPYFKKNVMASWDLSSYFDWCKKINPFIRFEKCKTDYINCLEEIKNKSSTTREISSKIELLKKPKKNVVKEANKTINLNYGNIYCDNSTHHGSSIITVSNSNACEAESSKRKHNTLTSEDVAVTNVINESCESKEGNRMNSLFSYVYKLHNKQSVDLNVLEKVNAVSVIDSMYNACVDLIKEFNQLNSIQKSYLHVLLSSCLNTITTDYRVTLKGIIGASTLQSTLTTHNDLLFSKYNEPEWLQIKDKIKNIYLTKGKKGVRVYVLKEKQNIYENNLEDCQILKLKVLDIYELILNTISYSNWSSESSEEDYGCYWKSIFQILFRKTAVFLKRGETCSTSSRNDRQLNEYEYGLQQKNVIGRKIDLLLVGYINDDGNAKHKIKLSSLEIKPENVSNDTEIKQINKNIRINKSILYNAFNHMGGINNDNLYILGIDIIGFMGYIYSLSTYEGIVVAKKLTEKNMFLPSDDDDLEQFIMDDTLDQLLNYMSNLCCLHSRINKSSREFKRSRKSSRTSSSINPLLQSPPREQSTFPSTTFYSPKKNE